MPIPAGQMNREVDLAFLQEERDDEGQVHDDPQPLARVWARRETLGGSERFSRQQVVAETTVRYTIHWRNDLDPTNGLFDVEEARWYDVRSVQEMGNHEYLLLECLARAER